MANRLKMEQKEILFALFSQNWSIRKINKVIGIHRKTISGYRKKWLQHHDEKTSTNSTSKTYVSAREKGFESVQSVPLRENHVPPDGVVHFEVPTDSFTSHEKDTSKSKASLFHEKICEKLTKGQQARSIYQDLVVENGFDGSYDSVKRYVRKLKKKTPDLYARIETPPGEEAQVDFGEGAPTLTRGKYKKPWLFVITLSNSRKSYEECVWKQDVETFIRCHENAFKFFGGVTRIIKLDNLKSGVLKAHLYEPELNPNYLAFSEHYCIIPLPCRVRTPEHKGKVESNIDYVQNNALRGKRFNCLEEQNRYLRQWNKTWASTRIHGTTKRQVNLMFKEEQPFLKPLPVNPFAFFKIGTRKVSGVDSHIEVQGAYYPIPPRYMGRQVKVHYNSIWVKVFYQDEMIQHLSAIEKGRFHPDRSCLPTQKNWNQQKYIQYLMRRCSVIGPSVLMWAKMAEANRQERAYRSIQGILSLSKKYPYSTINTACQKSIEQNVFSYHIVKELAESIRIQKQVQQEINFTQESQYIRSPQEYQNLITGDANG
jgi:transposase